MQAKRFLTLALPMLLAACADNELVGIPIALAKDGSGTLTARSLQAASAPGPAEARARGVQWQARANLMASQGTFRNIGDLSFGDGEVRFVTTNNEMPHLRV